MEIKNSYFENNKALKEGGVIKFNSFWPEFLNCTSIDNFAPYGNVLGSYPVEIRISKSLIDTASG